MTTKIISEKDQPLTKRKELIIEVEHNKQATPKTEDVLKSIAEKTKADENLISVKEIKNDFGSNVAKVVAYIYSSVEAKDAIEKIKKKKILEAERKAAWEAKKKAEEEAKAPEETPAEKPAEAPKEEAKAEEVEAKE